MTEHIQLMGWAQQRHYTHGEKFQTTCTIVQLHGIIVREVSVTTAYHAILLILQNFGGKRSSSRDEKRCSAHGDIGVC